MAASSTGSFRTCPEGHPVLAVDLYCSTCGVRLKGKDSRAAKAGAADPIGDGADDADDADPPTDRAPGKASRFAGLREAAQGASKATWIALAMVVATLTVGIIVAITLKTNASGPSAEPGPDSGFAGACGGLAVEEIALNADVATGNDRLCIVVGEASAVTIGAIASSNDADLMLDVTGANGEPIASNDDTYGDDPEVSFDAAPGTYVIAVSRYGGGSIGIITVYTAAAPVSGGAQALPSLDDCASLSAPAIEGSGTGERVAGEPFTCVNLDAPAFAKIGAEADPNAPTDLMLALYAYDDSGSPQFVRSVDDTFATDPEINIALEAGSYLIEATAHDGGIVGPYSVYVDTAGTYYRTGEVSSGLATLTPSSCATLPQVNVGSQRAFGSGTPMGCLTLDAPTIVVIKAATSASQDLTLEVVGFDSIGAPRRYVWADEDVFGEDFDSQDPRVELRLPAGSYVVAVGEYWGQDAPHDFTLTVDAE